MALNGCQNVGRGQWVLCNFNYPPNTLISKIDKLIRQKQDHRITYAEFMRLCLYDPEFGYYSAGKVKINQGHFTTNPETYSPKYGQALSRAIVAMNEALGAPKKFTIVELGAGNGTMARDILDELRRSFPEVYRAVRYIVVEISPFLARDQRAALAGHQVIHLNSSTLALPLRGIEGIIISNELPDAFPVHRVIYDDHPDQMKEVYISEFLGRLHEELGPLSDHRIREYFEQSEHALINGQVYNVNLNMIDWLQGMATALKRGFVLTIDYGTTLDQTEPAGSLRCYGAGGPVSRSVCLREPGSVDMTGNIHLDVYSAYASRFGLTQLYLGEEPLFFDHFGDRFIDNEGYLNPQVILHAKGTLPSPLVAQVSR